MAFTKIGAMVGLLGIEIDEPEAEAEAEVSFAPMWLSRELREYYRAIASRGPRRVGPGKDDADWPA